MHIFIKHIRILEIFLLIFFFNSTLESFNDKIIMNIQESGNYQINVIIAGSADKYVYGSERLFTIDFEVR